MSKLVLHLGPDRKAECGAGTEPVLLTRQIQNVNCKRCLKKVARLYVYTGEPKGDLAQLQLDWLATEKTED